MESFFSHAFVGLALGRAYAHEQLPLRFWLLSIVWIWTPALALNFAIYRKQRRGLRLADLRRDRPVP